MDQGYRDFAVVPSADTVGFVQLGKRDMAIMQPFHDPLQIMLIPIGHQKRLAVCRLDNVLQSVQLLLVNGDRIPGIVVNGTIGHLGELAGEGCSISSGYFTIGQVQNELFFHLVVGVLLIGTEIDLVFAGYEFRHLQVVRGFHRNGDIRDFPVYGLLGTGFRTVAVNDLAVHGDRHEILLPIIGNEPTEAFSHVDDLELCPQIHQSVAGWSAGEPNDTLDSGPYLHQSLEAF